MTVSKSIMAFNGDDFARLSSKIAQLSYGRTENNHIFISKILDELNSLNYKYPLIKNQAKAVLLINQCCSLIPPEDVNLVLKCCLLISNLINHQSVVIEGRTLILSVQWCLEALKNDKGALEKLKALDALLRSNLENSNNLIYLITDKNSPILGLICNGDQEIVLFAMQCLEACTYATELRKQNVEKFENNFKICYDIFLGYLCENHENSPDKLLHIKIVIKCLQGLQNLITQNCELLNNDVGIILGVIKSYMLYNVKEIEFLEPRKLLPSSMSIPEPSTTLAREKKGGKITKQRKHRSKSNKRESKKVENNDFDTSRTPSTQYSNLNLDNGNLSSIFNRLKTSDSDFSDNEGGKAAKIAITAGRVRQAALNLFYNTIKFTEKNIIFSYWSSFIPENSLSGKHNLTNCILKDTSARGRMSALNVLVLLLTSSKLYLAQAGINDQTTSFTPFSAIIGYMLNELHRILSLALNEYSIPVLTQVLKCFAALVQATPYYRLKSGLMNKVIRNIKPFIYHKDPTVQVSALIAIGCTLASEPPVTETRYSYLRTEGADELQMRGNCSKNNDFADFSVDSDATCSVNQKEMSWLLEKCLTNLGLHIKGFGEQVKDCSVVSGPVKLESLQILSAMSQNYFEILMAPHMSLVTEALDISLTDKYTDLRLHAGRAVDFIGQAMNRYLINQDARFFDQCLSFWNVLLNNSLISLLQSELHPTLRAVGCDCLGSIGACAFECLPSNKQILCVTLLFSCSRDEENSVKGAAVRALAICVLYPSLSEDPGFVIDTSEAVYRTLNDENSSVKVKASWSLANLSDALVLNKSNLSFCEEFPNSLLLKLLQASIKGSNDCDKIKMNAVRALGNILQLVDDNLMQNSIFNKTVNEAWDVLIKNCTTGSNMKVRWNACYAVGNALKNCALYKNDNTNWRENIFISLTDLVKNFRNFKVRINAAVALSSPSTREFYGDFYFLLWKSLLIALENSENIDDFNEYKHRDNLVEQICLTLGHLTILLEKADLTRICDVLMPFIDSFKVYMRKVLDRMLPEKSAVLFDASSHLSQLRNSCLSFDQSETLKYLEEVFFYQL